jgi:hypothetical protein
MGEATIGFTIPSVALQVSDRAATCKTRIPNSLGLPCIHLAAKIVGLCPHKNGKCFVRSSDLGGRATLCSLQNPHIYFLSFY